MWFFKLFFEGSVNPNILSTEYAGLRWSSWVMGDLKYTFITEEWQKLPEYLNRWYIWRVPIFVVAISCKMVWFNDPGVISEDFLQRCTLTLWMSVTPTGLNPNHRFIRCCLFLSVDSKEVPEWAKVQIWIDRALPVPAKEAPQEEPGQPPPKQVRRQGDAGGWRFRVDSEAVQQRRQSDLVHLPKMSQHYCSL